MTLRRVPIDDDPAPTYYLEPEEALAPEDDDDDGMFYGEPTVDDLWDEYERESSSDDADVMSPEFNRLYQGLLDHGWSHDAILEAVGLRTRDLAPAAPVDVPPAGRDRGRGFDVSKRGVGGSRYALGHLGEAVGTGEADGPDLVIPRPRRYEDDSRTVGAQWLVQNDPMRTRAGVTDAVATALRIAELSADDVRLALSPGKPNAVRRELRARLRHALAEYDDAKREWVAEALGCTTKAVQRLLKT